MKSRVLRLLCVLFCGLVFTGEIYAGEYAAGEVGRSRSRRTIFHEPTHTSTVTTISIDLRTIKTTAANWCAAYNAARPHNEDGDCVATFLTYLFSLSPFSREEAMGDGFLSSFGATAANTYWGLGWIFITKKVMNCARWVNLGAPLPVDLDEALDDLLQFILTQMPSGLAMDLARIKTISRDIVRDFFVKTAYGAKTQSFLADRVDSMEGCEKDEVWESLVSKL